MDTPTEQHPAGNVVAFPTRSDKPHHPDAGTEQPPAPNCPVCGRPHVEFPLLSTADAHAYIAKRTGDLAPSRGTLENWARKAWRDAHPDLAATLPAPQRLEGTRRGALAWHIADLDRWLASLVTAFELQPPPAR